MCNLSLKEKGGRNYDLMKGKNRLPTELCHRVFGAL